MHIGFDNTRPLMRNVYYFKYKGTKFKLIQNTQKYKDVLLSILPNHNDQGTEKVFEIASEFLNALAWRNHSLITVSYIGGHSSDRVRNLKQAKCCSFSQRSIPGGYIARTYSLQGIPQIENENQKIALALFREARSSLNHYLGVLFYWQILEIGQGSNDRTDWVNRVFADKRIHINEFYLRQLALKNNNIAIYFKDECRDAIAHIKRWTGKRSLALDSYLDT